MLIIFMDIDGTIADASSRFKIAGTEPRKRGEEYTKWLKNVQSPALLAKDKTVPGMLELTHKLKGNFVYLTGRSTIYRDATIQWLKANGFPEALLFMRAKGSRVPAGAFKELVINNIVRVDDEVIVIDDDHTGELELVCKRRGWTFLKARSGS